MLTSNEILAKLENNLEIVESFGVKNIGLFGSFARGEQTELSDIDILVEFKKRQKTFDHYMELKFFLEDLFGRKVDLVILEAVKPELKASINRSVRYAKGA